MDINQQLQPIVANLLDSLKISIEGELRERVSAEVTEKIASAEIHSIVSDLIQQHITRRLDGFNFIDVSNETLTKSVNKLVDQIEKTLANTAKAQITTEINNQLALVNVNELINSIVGNKISSLVSSQSFPEGSIPHSSIDFRGLGLTGDQVKGGIIENFGSTGIEDRATHVQMTLMDHATAFEGPLWAPAAVIKGDLSVDGNLILKGIISPDSPAFASIVEHSSSAVRDSLNQDLFQSYSDIISKNIREQGLDLDRLTQGGKEIIKGPQLGYHITDSNLQRVGILRDLQTSGENYLCNTLYVTNGRAGVNTMDPSATFVVWDEEVEIVTTKRSQDTGYIGTSRYQRLVLGSNGKENIVLDVDGNVKINRLTLNKVNLTSAATIPNFEGTKGDIVYNEQPEIGSPIGWVCLGSTRWAKFGIIE